MLSSSGSWGALEADAANVIAYSFQVWLNGGLMEGKGELAVGVLDLVVRDMVGNKLKTTISLENVDPLPEIGNVHLNGVLAVAFEPFSLCVHNTVLRNMS